MTELPLPELTPEEQEHSRRLVDRIRDEIEASNGWISFERYMELALYEPGLGYYSAGSTKLGRAGDFVTAPEISALFSRCVARQCREIFGRTQTREVLEFGAGSGVMAADVLQELEACGSLPDAYSILEVSADLRQRQAELIRQRVPRLAERVRWLDAMPARFSGVMLGNEVLDALPIQRFRMRGTSVNTLGVTWQLGRLDWSETHADQPLEAAVRAIEAEVGEPLPDGYTSEINLRLRPWIAAIGAALEKGVALFIDYGLPQRQYYRPDRREGTLLCHFRHRFHDDPLSLVGVQDIGAWVDFTAVANAAIDSGLRVEGYTTQAHFLIGNGIESMLAPTADEDLTTRVQLARQAMLLTLPGEMGERFKVIGLSAGLEDTGTPLDGFKVRDLTATL